MLEFKCYQVLKVRSHLIRRLYSPAFEALIVILLDIPTDGISLVYNRQIAM